ncbi:hypothetical protein D3C87_1455800 [compost metagenome]
MIPVSMLLKSWAMPPVSWPTASIFCAWRNASSARSRSNISLSSFSLASASCRVRALTRSSRVSLRLRRASSVCLRSVSSITKM